MKIKKALTTLAVTTILTAILVAPALAKDIVYPPTPLPTPLPTSMSDESTVTANVAQTYTVVIPNTVDFDTLEKDTENKEIVLPVTVKNLLIDKNQTLKINVKGDNPNDNAFTIRTTGGASIAYEVYKKDGAAVNPNGEFASVTPADPPATPDTPQDISGTLKQTGAVINAGRYEGKLIFTCTVQ